MGAHLWFYFVPYEPDIDQALQRLKRREFSAGRYNPVIPFPRFPIDSHSPSPGSRHGSIEEAVELSAPDGTRSILDMHGISEKRKHGWVTGLSEERLRGLFGTTQPTREMIESAGELPQILDRGVGIFVIVYTLSRRSEIFFAGYSYD